MRSDEFTLIVIIFICLGFCLTGCSNDKPTINLNEFHVHLEGNDNNIGSIESPFQTIERAKQEVQRKIALGLQNSVTVFLHSGVYELSESLVFGPQDSGTSINIVTYKPYQNDIVVVSGGQRIINWKINGNGQWIAELPDVKAGKWFFRQLVVENKRATRARWPNEEGSLRIESVTDGVKHFTFNQSIPQVDLAGQNTEMVVYEDWSITRGVITAADGPQLTTATPMGWIGHSLTTASPGKTGYLENSLAFLDKPGEWFLDRTSGFLRYIPLDGEDMTKATVVAPRLERLLIFTGTKDKPVRNIHFEGIRFEHTDFPLPDFGYNEIQAGHFGTEYTKSTHVSPVAVQCVYVEGVRFERCSFAHMNNSGVGFGLGCRNNIVSGSIFDDIGGNGIMVGWRGAGKLTSGALDADWADPTDAPTGNEISNCTLQRCGADSRGAVGVYVAFSADTRVAHNIVREMPYTGISVGMRWNSTPSTQKRSLVEYNHIYNVMKQLADGGGIYTLGLQPDTVFRGNYIHDIYRSIYAYGASNNGFFIDEGSMGFLFDSNVVQKAVGETVRFNQSKYEFHEWRNNFFGDDEAVKKEAETIINNAGLEISYR